MELQGKELKALMEELKSKHAINCWDYLDFGATSRKNDYEAEPH